MHGAWWWASWPCYMGCVRIYPWRYRINARTFEYMGKGMIWNGRSQISKNKWSLTIFLTSIITEFFIPRKTPWGTSIRLQMLRWVSVLTVEGWHIGEFQLLHRDASSFSIWCVRGLLCLLLYMWCKLLLFPWHHVSTVLTGKTTQK